MAPKARIVSLKALWFYGQFVFTLWCLWNHKNKVIFQNQSPNPQNVIQQQRNQMRWMASAVQEIPSNQAAVVIQPQIVNNQESSLNTSHSFGDTWTLFLDVRKNRNVQWYGTSALIRGLDGNSILFAGAMR